MAEEIQTKVIQEEMKNSYLDYAMSVITARALPDVYDGLKPVHRRILYTMHTLGLTASKPTIKCARIVGDAMGKFHPHGNLALYESLVRMAQDFSLRYPLIKGQGNFGSTEFSAAADRYTEAKMMKITEVLLEDLDKETVKMVPNYDASLEEPAVLPAKIPNLLINGSSGIAVGMATNIPPHNLTEVTQAIIATLQNPDIPLEELMHYIKGPDFPTGAIIQGTAGIAEAYRTGKGKISVKAKTHIEGRNIIITEIPYQIGKGQLIEHIVELVKNKIIEGISDIRDESAKEIRLVITTKKDQEPEIILNQLYQHSELKNNYSISMIALHEGQPKLMTLKNLITHYINHRLTIITKRTQYDLRKAEERKHLIEGLQTAIQNIDHIINLIKQANSTEEARQHLMNNYPLSDLQANAILDMKLSKLTNLETTKLHEEREELLRNIQYYHTILNSEQEKKKIITKELETIKEQFGDERRTAIETNHEEITEKALIQEEDIVIVLTQSGYIKQLPLTEYKQQRRGGKGVIGTTTKEEDIVKNIFITSNHNKLLTFTNKGKIYWLAAHELPEGSRYAKGKALVNLLNLQPGENVGTILPIKSYEGYALFTTKKGTVKKTKLKEYSNERNSGIIAISLDEEDEVINVLHTNGNQELLLATKQGQAVRCNEQTIRDMGRTATGVRGIWLQEHDEVIGAELAQPGTTILTITELGYGKRTPIEDYRLTNRGGSGVINIKITEKNGPVAGITTVTEDEEVLFMTTQGQAIRVPVNNISSIGRNTQGVRIMKLNEGDKVNAIAKIEKTENP
ncbi:MAG TPA: DNA gyrase subunit A [Candidatus Nanoarchaeia archaeon]|nr:DNA gyrase subunit A [Candidatus Nanoarchaeia archaeon]